MRARRTPNAIPTCALGALLLGALACGPLGPIPGGRLSGTLAPSAPSDWSSTDSVKEVQLETRPSDPYSVNIWGVGIGRSFYVASGRGEESTWARNILEDPNVRLRVGETLYELRAVRVDDDQSREIFLEALARKYDWEPDGEEAETAWLFRLDPR